MPDSEAARRLRRCASWFGRINLLLGLILVALGVYLVRG
jgi:cytochrome c biogenesis protein CcdA